MQLLCTYKNIFFNYQKDFHYTIIYINYTGCSQSFFRAKFYAFHLFHSFYNFQDLCFVSQ